jgi:hypothetical protein
MRLAFDQGPEGMRAARDPCKKPMKKYQDKPTTERRQKWRAAIDRARQN